MNIISHYTLHKYFCVCVSINIQTSKQKKTETENENENNNITENFYVQIQTNLQNTWKNLRFFVTTWNM